MAFLGGSAYAMANQIAEGFTTLSAVHLKRLTQPEMHQLKMELEKLQRNIRSEHFDPTEGDMLQKRNRKLLRINQGLQMINHMMMGKT